MLILGIDTSCDDTCISLLGITSCKSRVLSNVISSQVKLHAKYGGIYPLLAKREHKKNLPVVFKKALRKVHGKKIDLIGITIGPGLEPCLWEGVNFAKNLAEKFKIALIPINHLEAHILINFLDKSPILNLNSQLFPAVCLVVSGGHTILFLMEKNRKYKIIGQTRDDAAGECFDKVARLLGLGYPGGPAIAAEAAKLKTKNYRLITKLPRPMIYHKNYDFSFSGLKTAVLYDFKSRSQKERKSKEYTREMAKEVQQSVVDVLIFKTLKAAREFRAKSIILGGGVAANEELRRQFNYELKAVNQKINFLVPPLQLCTDNALMIAIATYFNREKTEKIAKIESKANLNI